MLTSWSLLYPNTQNTPANYLGAQKTSEKRSDWIRSSGWHWALLSYVDARGYHTKIFSQRRLSGRSRGRPSRPRLAREPNLGEAWVARGYYHYDA